MTHILERIICCENADVPRFIAFYDQLIMDGKLKSTKRYESTKTKVKLLPDEEVEAKAEKKRLKKEAASSAANKNSNSSMASLE